MFKDSWIEIEKALIALLNKSLIRIYYNFLNNLLLVDIPHIPILKMMIEGLSTTFKNAQSKNIDLS